MAELTKKNDFVELKFTGYSNGEVFDSNIEEDLKKISPKSKTRETIVVIGQGMVVPGLDKALEGKEIGREYEINVPMQEGFGERKRELIKTIPLKIFTEKKIDPYPGLVLTMDDALAKIIAVSGARVITDFNNPLASRDLRYRFTIVRKIEDEKEKCKVLFELVFRFVPEFELKEEIIVKGPGIMETYVKAFSGKFKELVGKNLKFELKEEKKSEETAKEQEIKEKKNMETKEEGKQKTEEKERKEINDKREENNIK